MTVALLTAQQAESLQGVEVVADKYCVYRHIRLDKNEPFYIGIGSTLYRPYSEKGRNKHWHSVVKHTDYRVDIIFENVSKEFAMQKEIELIALYGKKQDGGILVNVSDGGDNHHSRKATDEEREERRKRMIENNHFAGRKHSEESKAKMRAAKLGTKRPPEGYIKRAEKMKKYRGENHWGGKMLVHNETGIFYHTLLEATEAMGLKYIKQLQTGIKKGKINCTILC